MIGMNFENVDFITISDLVERAPAELSIEVLAGSTALNTKRLTSDRLQKMGLAFAGFTNYIHSGRIQTIGQSEISYLTQLDDTERQQAIFAIDPEKLSCILITKGLDPPLELLTFADENNIPLLRTGVVSSKVISKLTMFLQRELAEKRSFHGVLIEMYGIGLLLFGESGIGKSECALDLIIRGHRLVADDAVLIHRIGEKLEGFAPPLTKGYLEIRGLGILDVRQLYGISSVKGSISIDLCIELKKWSKGDSIERIGLDTQYQEILEIETPKFVLPVSSGRNLSTLVETAIRVFLSRRAGYDAADKLVRDHTDLLGK